LRLPAVVVVLRLTSTVPSMASGKENELLSLSGPLKPLAKS